MEAYRSEIAVLPLPKGKRIQELESKFINQYKKRPDFYVRVPGRVNLIGEHIDYCGYGVCPMALKQDVLLAISVENDMNLMLANIDPIFAPFKCDLREFVINNHEGAPQWHMYFLCGLKGILESFPKDVRLRGMRIFVSGNVPRGAGLSSSSALVSAAALGTAFAHNFLMPKEKIADICAKCERYIGTQGGGMDQAIAFLATEGCAKFIEFNPLRSIDVQLPQGAVFVISHSLAELNKAATNDYNYRVVECRIAAQIIAKRQALEWKSIRKLGDLHKALGSDTYDFNTMIKLVQNILHSEPYSREEILRELQTSNEELVDYSLTHNTRHIQSFKLHQRALHVFTEAQRVEKFHQACASSKDINTLKYLGNLMSQSHESLRDLYECSHPRLDRLVEISKGFTLGSRLTGAGWGGCVVSLVQPENVQKYMDVLRERFYGGFVADDQLDSIVFTTVPNSGACIYKY